MYMDEIKTTASIFQILSSKRFTGLFWTQFLTSFNDNFFKNAIIALINFGSIADKIPDDDRKKWIILAGLCFILPYFLFSATAGKLAESGNRVQIVRIIKYLEIGILGVGGLGFVLEDVHLMFAMLFGMGVHSTIFSPIKFGVLPIYLHKRDLMGGNALIEMATFLAIILGTIAGTQVILHPSWGEMGALGLMIFVAIWGLWTSYKMPRIKSNLRETLVGLNMYQHNKEVFNIMWSEKKIFGYITAGGWFWFVAAVIMTILPIYITDILFMDKDVYTLMLVIFSVGVGAGSVLCAKLLNGDISARFTPLAALTMGIFCIDIAFASKGFIKGEALSSLSYFLDHPKAWRIIFDFLMISGAGGFYVVPFFTLVQHETKKEEKSRMIAGNNIFNAFAMVLGGFFMLAMTDLNISIIHIFMIIGGLCFVGGTAVHFFIEDSIFRRMR